MREILFRGKDIETGRLVCGYYTFCPKGFSEEGNPKHVIRDTREFASKIYFVDSETVCQYTGLNDSTAWDELTENEKEKFLSEWNHEKNRKNTKDDWHGRKIFDGDIISFVHTKWINEDDGFPIMDNFKEYTRNYAVESVNTYHTYGLRARNKSIHFMLSQATINTHNARVIGNVFDNTEILKGDGSD